MTVDIDLEMNGICAAAFSRGDTVEVSITGNANWHCLHLDCGCRAVFETCWRDALIPEILRRLQQCVSDIAIEISSR